MHTDKSAGRSGTRRHKRYQHARRQRSGEDRFDILLCTAAAVYVDRVKPRAAAPWASCEPHDHKRRRAIARSLPALSPVEARLPTATCTRRSDASVVASQSARARSPRPSSRLAGCRRRALCPPRPSCLPTQAPATTACSSIDPVRLATTPATRLVELSAATLPYLMAPHSAMATP